LTFEQLIDLLPPTLQHLELPDASMTVVPASVGKFTALCTLNLWSCTKLTALPESVGNLCALQILSLNCCESLTALPESVGNLGALQTLDLYHCKRLTALPESVGDLGALHTLDLIGCEKLTALPESVGNLGALQTLDLWGCCELTALPESVGDLGALQTLNLCYCSKLKTLPESVGNLGALRTLKLYDCTKLKSLPASVSQLTQLDEASRKQVEAILRGALAALPCAGQSPSLGRLMSSGAQTQPRLSILPLREWRQLGDICAACSAERARAEGLTNAVTAVFTARSLSHVFHTKADGQEAQALTGDDFMNAVFEYMQRIGKEERNAIETEVNEYMASIGYHL
jgi:Leucine-rich repeat (LRR) protein